MKQTSCFTHPAQPFSPAHPGGSYSIRCVACHHPLTTQHLESLADRLHGNASGGTRAGLLCGGGRCKPADCCVTLAAALAENEKGP